MAGEIDTTNRFFVGVQGDAVVLLRPVQRLSKDDALNLAAYLVALTDMNNEFPAILEAVRNT